MSGAVFPLFILIFLALLKWTFGFEIASWTEVILKIVSPGIFVGLYFASVRAIHRAGLGWKGAEYFMLFTGAVIFYAGLMILIQVQFSKAITRNPEICSANYVLEELCSVAYSSDMFQNIK